MFTTGYDRPDWQGHTLPHLSKPVEGLFTAKDCSTAPTAMPGICLVTVVY